MAGKIILSVTGGELAGTRYRFDTKMLCLIGRAENCNIQLTGAAAEGVSRHHCILDIRPPRALLQDLGSRNGTFLNEYDIGDGGKSVGEKELPFYELSDGDSIRIAGNVFRISLVAASKCHVCHKNLPDNTQPDPVSGNLICHDCLAAGLSSPILPASKTLPVRTCKVCGIKVTFPPGQQVPAPDEFICADCLLRNSDPNSTFRIPEDNKLPSNLFSLPGYRILRHLGRGGMGEVYLGQSTETLEKVAVKVLRPDIAYFDSCRSDFQREADNLKQLKHPNIVELKAFHEDDGAFFLILEYCSGGTLRSWMKQHNGPLELRLALDIIYQVLDGLHYAHHVRFRQVSPLDDSEHMINGIVHRDITPGNIFISVSEGVPCAKISDFGLAKAFDMAGISGCTRTGDFSGTLGFICKQQYLNYKYVRPEVDVWAAAATLFYMLTGSAPRDFSANSPGDGFNTPPFSIVGLNKEVTPALAKVIDDALDDRGKLRYSTAEAFKMALMDADTI